MKTVWIWSAARIVAEKRPLVSRGRVLVSSLVLATRRRRFVAAVATLVRYLEKARSSVDRPPPSDLRLCPARISPPSHGLSVNRLLISFDRSNMTKTVLIGGTIRDSFPRMVRTPPLSHGTSMEI